MDPQRGRPAGIRLKATKLRRLRRSRGLTQAEVAKRSGVTTRTVVAAESGKAVSGSTAWALVRVFDVDLLDVVEPAVD